MSAINNNFWSRVSKQQENFTKKERIIINYIANNSHKMLQVTIEELSKENKVGYSVVYSLINKLGFGGYRDFIISLAAEENTFHALNREFFGNRNDLKDFYKKLLDLNDSSIDYNRLQEFITWLDKRRTSIIYIAGIGFSGLGAEDLAYKLFRFGLKVICLNNNDDTILMHSTLLTEKDILIVFSLSGKTKTIIEAVNFAKSNGATVIAITSQDKSVLHENVDWSFTIASSSVYQNKGVYISPLFAITYFNDLITCYILKLADKEWYLNNHQKTSRIGKKFD